MATRTPERFRLDELRIIPGLAVFAPGDPGYDDARATWNTVHEHHPLAVALPIESSAVVAAIDFARRNGIRVGIQSTGHGPIVAVDNALLINLRHMNRVELDVATRSATVEGGAKWQAVLDVAAPHGLAPLLGSTPDVSAVGYTLGGGLGWLARKFGASADSVRSFEVVTADARVVRASADEHTDLFWALRGAGAGHLGVVTAMEIDLYDVPGVYGGNLFYPAAMAGDVLRRWRDWLPSIPTSFTSGVALVNFPDDEAMPPEMRAKAFVCVRGAVVGKGGQRLLSHWRNWETPEIDAFGPLPIDRIAEISDDPLEPFPNEGTGLWMRSLRDRSIDAMVDELEMAVRRKEFLQIELRHAGGALTRRRQSAYANREGLILFSYVADAFDPARVPLVQAAVARLRGRMAPDLTGGLYLNFIDGPERRHGVRQGIGADHAYRLAAIKKRWDPDNLFDFGLDARGA